MASFIYYLNIVFLLVSLLQRILILANNVYRWYKYGHFADLPAGA